MMLVPGTKSAEVDVRLLNDSPAIEVLAARVRQRSGAVQGNRADDGQRQP
jgi:hypothetical protein